MAQGRTARYRAKLKAKKWRERMRKQGLMKKLKPGGRMKRPAKRTVGCHYR